MKTLEHFLNRTRLFREQQTVPHPYPGHFLERVARDSLAGPVESYDTPLVVEHDDKRVDHIEDDRAESIRAACLLCGFLEVVQAARNRWFADPTDGGVARLEHARPGIALQLVVPLFSVS